jgi:signal transduction histidine kinase
VDGTVGVEVRPNKEFRGWLWQNAYCQETDIEPTSIGCKKRTYFSVRLPIQVLQDDLFASKQAKNVRPVWPPADLSSIKVAVKVLAPPMDYSISDTKLFDSNDAIEIPRFALQDLKPLLLAGETLTITSSKNTQQKNIITALQEDTQKTSAFLTRLIEWLPVHQDYSTAVMQTSAQISTESDTFDLALVGNMQSINQSLSVVASRVAWYVGAMLIAIALIWLLIEIGIIRRIIKLTKRAAMLSNMVKNTNNLAQFQLADMRGVDEIGVLSGCLHDLLQRVKGDVERETIRVAQERDMWNAVGHEIMSPLQSLIALHGQPDDPSQRYINRMQQAIRILYGSASPSEAFETTQLQITRIDIVTFLNSVANNAASAGIAQVIFINATKKSTPIFVNADEYSLEDVITHVLKNADRFRVANSIITMQLQASENAVSITIHNDGPNIEAEFMDKIFEYGVSDQLDAAAVGNRGQGLFVAKTYMAKMGGTISVQNTAGGVSFILSLQRTIGV